MGFEHGNINRHKDRREDRHKDRHENKTDKLSHGPRQRQKSRQGQKIEMTKRGIMT